MAHAPELFDVVERLLDGHFGVGDADEIHHAAIMHKRKTGIVRHISVVFEQECLRLDVAFHAAARHGPYSKIRPKILKNEAGGGAM